MEKPKVLGIEDDPGVRDVVCRVLAEFGGYETTGVASGRQGVDALAHDGFGLVITDIFMPDQDGIETIVRIHELNPTIPVIAISGSDSGGFSPLEDALAMGANRALKPFGVKELLATVREVLESATPE
jgi:CheY-like chemotaxis protein